MGAKKFNAELSKQARTKIVNFEDFIKMNHTTGGFKSTENMIAAIKEVKPVEKGLAVQFESGRCIKLNYNGTYEKYRVDGKLASIGGYGTGKGIYKGHVLLRIDGIAIFLERFIAICGDILQDEMALSYKGWDANVMDGSGSSITSKKLDIPMNFNPDNIEWCLRSDNACHGAMILPMKHRTNHVYQFSARDKVLREIFQTKGNQELINYCVTNLKLVK